MQLFETYYVSVRTLTGTSMVRAFVYNLKFNEHIN